MTTFVRIERALLWRLTEPLDPLDPEGAGLGIPVRRLTRDEVATLLVDALGTDMRSARARNALDVVSRSTIDLVRMPPADGSPSAPRADDDLVAVATIDIAPGFGWRAGFLHDVHRALPDSVLNGAYGRPIGDLVDAPGIDRTRIMAAPPENLGDIDGHHARTAWLSTTAVIYTGLDVVTLTVPSMLRRIAVRRRAAAVVESAKARMNALRSSPPCGPGRPVPPWGRGRPEPGRIYKAPPFAPVCPTLPPLSPLSPSGPWDDGYSNIELLKIKALQERGFNEFGHPY